MWNLLIIDRQSSSKEWQKMGFYDTLKDAAKAIIVHENIPVNGLFLELYVGANDESDSEVLSAFTYDGKKALYTVKKSCQ